MAIPRHFYINSITVHCMIACHHVISINNFRRPLQQHMLKCITNAPIDTNWDIRIGCKVLNHRPKAHSPASQALAGQLSATGCTCVRRSKYSQHGTLIEQSVACNDLTTLNFWAPALNRYAKFFNLPIAIILHTHIYTPPIYVNTGYRFEMH